MSKKRAFSNPALTKRSAPVKEEKKFNLVTESKANAFRSVFDTQPLSPREEATIERLLVENTVGETSSNVQIPEDIGLIKEITKEIKAIGNQGAFLIGERVSKAREILKRYKKETFGHWLEEIFGNRRTGYNFLSYYELWEDLPTKELKEKYQSMPRGAAYMLASRTVGIKEKVTFIDKFFNLKARNLILELRKRFPSPKPTKQPLYLLAQMRNLAEKIEEEVSELTREDLEDLKVIQKAIASMTLKYLNNPRPQKVSISSKNPKEIVELLKKTSTQGNRFILKDREKEAALIPLEDLALLENRE